MPDIDDMVEKLEEKSGQDYDRSFLETMIIHHQQAVDMSRQAQDKAESDELKEMAADMMTKQEAEIAKMEEMLAKMS